MNTDKRTDYLTRDGILKLLSDAEVARVSTAESATSLPEGDEYLDLAHLAKGVQTAHGVSPMGRVVPRKAVNEATWSTLLTHLGAPAPKAPPAPPRH
jgi:hypothetical protein